MRGSVLVVEQVNFIRLRGEKKAVEPLEVTVDFLEDADLADLVDRCSVAFRCQSRGFSAVQLFDLNVAIVECVGKMSGGTTCHTTANQSIVEHYDGTTFTSQQVGRRKSCDARADDANLGADAFP